jgi:hypothetical protein
MPLPSAGICFVLFEVVLLTRSIRHLLRPGQPGLEEPARGLARELQEAIKQTNDPVENLIRSLWEALQEPENPDQYLLEKISIYGRETALLHRHLGFLGRFELPPELEQALFLAHQEISFPYPDRLHLASSGSFDILEHRGDYLSGRATSIIAVPAALCNMPLYWPLVAHEYGHRYLRGRTEANTSRETPFLAPIGDVPPELQTPLQNWKREVLCDRIGRALFGGAFAAPALAYFVNKLAFSLSDYSTSHPAPWVRLTRLLSSSSSVLEKKISGLCTDISRAAPQPPQQTMVPIACAACKTIIAKVEADVAPQIISREIDAGVTLFAGYLHRNNIGGYTPRIPVVRDLLKAFSKGLPVDLCFSPKPPQRLDLPKLRKQKGKAWSRLLGQLKCSPPAVAELFSAAWQERLDIQEGFRRKLATSSTRQELNEAMETALKSIFFLGENLLAGLRSLRMLRYLEEVLQDDPH